MGKIKFLTNESSSKNDASIRHARGAPHIVLDFFVNGNACGNRGDILKEDMKGMFMRGDFPIYHSFHEITLTVVDVLQNMKVR